MPLQIVGFTAENYKRLGAISLNPTERVIEIAGRNGQGKSSILDAIFAVLEGAKASRRTEQPIRDGQDSAWVALDFGDIIVTRRWTRDDAGTLTIETKPNHSGLPSTTVKRPQELLNKLLGSLTFNPYEFAELDAKKQVAALASVLDIDIDIDEIDADIEAQYEARKLVGQNRDQLQALVDSAPKHDDSLPAEPIEPADLLDEFQAAKAHNERMSKLAGSAFELAGEEESITRQIAELEARRETIKAMAAEVRAELAPLEAADEDEISARIRQVDETNSRIRAQKARREHEEKLSTFKQRYASHSLKIDELRAEKAKAVADSEFPISGLSFGEGSVLLNGIPLSQASQAEKRKVSIAVGMAANPDIRVMRVYDGSLLDDEAMQELRDLAADHDFQVWVERVGALQGYGYVIEDGGVQE
jgi:DNA repair exonuclease SbcCD ATPase subunit